MVAVTSSGGISLPSFGFTGSVNTGKSGSISVDPATPPVVVATGSAGTSMTTASFSPPANSLLVVLTSFEYQAANASSPVFTVRDSVSGTYAAGPSVFDGTRGATASWTRYLYNAPGAMTVTVANNGVTATHGQILAVYVLDGANSIQAKAAAATAHSGSAATGWTGVISTTTPGSWVMVAGAGSAEGTIAPNIYTTTLADEQDATDGVSLLTGRQIVPTGSSTSGGTTTALTITTTTLPGATAGTAYSGPLNAAGGTGSGYSWSVSSGSLPAGLVLSVPATGIINGTPTTAGTSSFTVKVTDSGNNTATQALSITVAASAPAMPVGPTGSWTLVFDDEFAGTALNTTNWTALQGASINNVSTEASAVSVSGGYCHVGYAGAICSSNQTGYAGPSTGPVLAVGDCCEAMINFPGPSGDTAYNWPAWWADGEDWPTRGEEDIFESYNGTPSALNYHSPSGANNGPFPSGSWCNSFHTYTLVRGATSLQCWWDGTLVRTVTPNDNGGAQGLIVNVGSGNTADESAVVLVKYVRMWTPG